MRSVSVENPEGGDGLDRQRRIYGGVNSRCVTVELLSGETILISTEGKTTCSAIWNRVEGELVARGVVHPQIFGLAIKAENQWVFVDPEAKVSKYFNKDCKSTSHNNPGSINDNKTPILYCRVNFYLDALPQSFDVVSLHHYYLQLRSNLVSAPRYPTENLTQIIAFAYQAEIGDWRPCQETPSWAKELSSTLGSGLTKSHQALAGLGQQAARIAFIRAVMPQYNMHLYTMKTKDGNAPVWIGVTPKGVTCEFSEGYFQNGVGCTEIPQHSKVTFLWANITKIYFERKKFEIIGRAWGGVQQKLCFTASSETLPRHLFILCRSTHQFLPTIHKILLQSELNNKGGGGGSSTGGESSCSSVSKNDEKMLDLSLWDDGLLLAGGESREHQRVSVISNASSNTTSGIVSDRVYSLDGSEEDLDLRYCCTDRPTNNSTSLESLSQKHTSHHMIDEEGENNHNNDVTESEAKFWYCDSDCESDIDRDCGPSCRSSALVQRMDEKHGCNSCEDELERLSLSNPSTVIKHNSTPSMVSEGTLKAVDICNCTDGETGNCNSSSSSENKDNSTCTKFGKETKITKTTSRIGENNNNNSSSGSTVTLTQTPKTLTNTTVSNATSKVTDKLDCSIIEKVGKVDTVTNCDSKEKDSIQKSKERLEENKKIFEYSNDKKKQRQHEEAKDNERQEKEDEEAEDDPMEHVYGEICEDPDNKTEEQEYFTIDTNNKGNNNDNSDKKLITANNNNTNNNTTTTATTTNKKVSSISIKTEENGSSSIIGTNKKQRHCVKSTSNVEISRVKCKGKLLKELKCSSGNSRKTITNHSSSCSNINSCVSIKCDNKCTVHAHTTTCGKECNRKNFGCTNVLGTKENGLTPKIASLKCLKSTQKGFSSLTCSSASWLPGGVSKKNALNSKKNYSNGLSSQQQQNDYVEFGEKLQQGHYPVQRTVSDNFETDSDYVQLPPLFPKPLLKKPTSKLWKLVTKTTSNKNSLSCRKNHKNHNVKYGTTTSTSSSSNNNKSKSTKCNNNSSPMSSSSSESMTLSPPSTPGPAVNLNTLPRRNKLDHGRSISNQPLKLSNMTKVSSKSTTALNNMSTTTNDNEAIDERKPEPPPKRGQVSSNVTSTKPVDARFIATKPQILVQTAYATAVAPVGIPSQSQVLFRTSKLPVTSVSTNNICGGTITSSSSSNGNTNYQPVASLSNMLHHSQRTQSLSVDNIYDTVASEIPLPPPTSSTPPPYPAKGGNSIIIKPNNYIDVHASAVKNRKVVVSHSKPKSFAQANGDCSHHNHHHHHYNHQYATTSTAMASSTNNNGGNENLMNSACTVLPNSASIPHHFNLNGTKHSSSNANNCIMNNNNNHNNNNNVANRCGSVPNNLNNFFIGLQNLKPLSRAPIIHPTATSSMSLSNNNNNSKNNNNHNSNQHHNHMINGNKKKINNSNVSCLHTSSATTVNLMGNNNINSTSLNYNVPCPHSCGTKTTVLGSQSATNVNLATTVNSTTTTTNNNNNMSLNNSNCNNNASGLSSSTSLINNNNNNSNNYNFGNCPVTGGGNGHSRFTTIYSQQLARSQIQQFKAQLYSDIDYVMFPTRNPRVNHPISQQDYYDSKSLSYTTLSSNDIPPPYLPPPPPYNPPNMTSTSQPNNIDKPPPRPIKTIGIGAVPANNNNNNNGFTNGSAHSVTASYSATSPSYNSYGSLYNIGSNNSQCSSSQYATGGYYAAVGSSLNLNAENIQRFLSTQSLASSNMSSAPPIYYPCSTQSAPPLPPSNNKNIIIENEMRKTLQNQIMNSRLNGGVPAGRIPATTMSEERMRMKSCRSEESLYTLPTEKLQEMYKLKPPPPYTKVSPSENLDLASLNAKCSALDLPLLSALLREQKKISEKKISDSDGSLLPQSKIRSTAHSHPKTTTKTSKPVPLSLPPKPLLPVPNTDISDTPPPLPSKSRV